MATPSGPGPSTRARLSIGRGLALFALYVFVFAAGGGIGAGVPSVVFELMTGEDLARGDQFMLYAIMFGVTGYIAVRLAQRVVEGGDAKI